MNIDFIVDSRRPILSPQRQRRIRLLEDNCIDRRQTIVATRRLEPPAKAQEIEDCSDELAVTDLFMENFRVFRKV